MDYSEFEFELVDEGDSRQVSESKQVPVKPSKRPKPDLDGSSWSNDKQLHPSFQKVVNGKKFFNLGRVFAMLWPQPAGPFAADTEKLVVGPFHQLIFSKIQRFVVIRNLLNHCLCLPIHTYGGRIDEKYTSKPHDQYSCFDARDPWDESRLSKKELPVVVEDPEIEINYPMARVDCSKIHTIEHYAIVRKIGRIDKKALPLLEECFRQALNVPLEAVDLESSSRTTITMHSPQNQKWHVLIAILDTGSNNNYMSKKVAERLGLRLDTQRTKTVLNWDGKQCFTNGTVRSVWHFQKYDTLTNQSEFWIVNDPPFDVLFGHDALWLLERNFMSSPIQGGGHDVNVPSPPGHSGGFGLRTSEKSPARMLQYHAASNETLWYPQPSKEPDDQASQLPRPLASKEDSDSSRGSYTLMEHPRSLHGPASSQEDLSRQGRLVLYRGNSLSRGRPVPSQQNPSLQHKPVPSKEDPYSQRRPPDTTADGQDRHSPTRYSVSATASPQNTSQTYRQARSTPQSGNETEYTREHVEQALAQSLTKEGYGQVTRTQLDQAIDEVMRKIRER